MVTWPGVQSENILSPGFVSEFQPSEAKICARNLDASMLR
jgi:hypothetical protein